VSEIQKTTANPQSTLMRIAEGGQMQARVYNRLPKDQLNSLKVKVSELFRSGLNDSDRHVQRS
jgi:hypothetical protein